MRDLLRQLERLEDADPGDDPTGGHDLDALRVALAPQGLDPDAVIRNGQVKVEGDSAQFIGTLRAIVDAGGGGAFVIDPAPEEALVV